MFDAKAIPEHLFMEMIAEMERRMNEPKHIDFSEDGYEADRNPEWLPMDDTQIGVEFAVEYLNSRMPAAGKNIIETLVEPIESAPKDGTIFWGIVRGDAIAVFWHEGFGEFVSSYRRMMLPPGLTWEDGKTYQDHSPVIHRPMSWLPKPKLPDTEDT